MVERGAVVIYCTHLWEWASRHLAIGLDPADSCPLYSQTWHAGS